MKKRTQYTKPFTLLSLFFTFILALGLLTGCGNNKKSSTKNKVLTFGSFATSIQPVLADKLGYFNEELKPYGYTVEVKTFSTGPEIREALEAGEIDFGTLGAQPAILANNNGTPLRIFGTYKATEKCNAMLVRSDAGIHSIQDLKGKKIGYTAGSTLHNLLLKILEKANLTEQDVELFNMDASEIKTSLETGDIDAGLLWEPYITQIEKEKNITELIDGTGLVQEVCGYVANEQFINEHPDLTAAVLKALDRSWNWAEENMDKAVADISKSSGSAEDEVQAIFDKSDGSTFLTTEKINAIDETCQYLYDQKLTNTRIKANDIITTDIQDKAGIAEK